VSRAVKQQGRGQSRRAAAADGDIQFFVVHPATCLSAWA
jgi:hypothetical protein